MSNCDFLTREAFENSFSELSTHETFNERISRILKRKHYNSERFCNDTELNQNIYSCLKKIDYKPSLRIVVSICIGLQLDVFETEDLLRLAGYVLVRTRKLDYAYSELLKESNTLTIEECNIILTNWGFKKSELLGSQSKE